jgi:hypothetical protein
MRELKRGTVDENTKIALRQQLVHFHVSAKRAELDEKLKVVMILFLEL